jgi:hypothetical protein
MSFDRNEVYECGAQLLALLAYPDPKEKEPHFDMVHACLCAHALHRICARNG